MKPLLFIVFVSALFFSCHSKYENVAKKTPFIVSHRNKHKKYVSVFVPKRYSVEELNKIAEHICLDIIDEENQSVYFYLNRKANKQAWARVYVKNRMAYKFNILGLTNFQIADLEKKQIEKKGNKVVGKWLNDSDKSLIVLYSDSIKPELMKLEYIFKDSIVSMGITRRTDYFGQIHYQFDEFESYIEIDKSGDMSMHFPLENDIYFNKF